MFFNFFKLNLFYFILFYFLFLILFIYYFFYFYFILFYLFILLFFLLESCSKRIATKHCHKNCKNPKIEFSDLQFLLFFVDHFLVQNASKNPIWLRARKKIDDDDDGHSLVWSHGRKKSIFFKRLLPKQTILVSPEVYPLDFYSPDQANKDFLQK